MPFTKTQIISNALGILGKKVTLSLVNQNDLVTVAEQSFDMIFEDVISKCFWRFSTTIAQLPQLNIVPVGGYWPYAYQLPGNYYQMVHLWPQQYGWEIYENNQLYSNFDASAGGVVPLESIAVTGVNIPLSYLNLSAPLPQNNVFAFNFAINGTGTLPTTSPQVLLGVTYYLNTINPNQVRIFANATDAANNVNFFSVSLPGINAILQVQNVPGPSAQGLFIEYQFLPLIQNLPPYFCRAMYYEVAAELSLSNAQSVAYYDPLRARADYLWSVARAKDAQNRPQTQLQSAPMITRRYVSVFVSG